MTAISCTTTSTRCGRRRPRSSAWRAEPRLRPIVLIAVLGLGAGCADRPERGASPSSTAAGETVSTPRTGTAAAGPGELDHAIPPEAAWTLVRLDDGRVLGEARAEILDTPVQPGSLMKIVALSVALEAGIVRRDTRLMCSRRVRRGQRVLDCSHPDLGRPLDAVEALAHSCNSFFAFLAERLSSAQLAQSARRLGLPAPPRTTDAVLAALGLDEYRVPPRQWVGALARLRDPIVVDGLREAALHGTASAVGGTVEALAKTATAAMPGGGQEGIAVVLAPAGQPRVGLAVVAPGGSGRDAAAIAARILAAHRAVADVAPTTALPDSIDVGVASEEGYVVRRTTLEDYVGEAVAGEMPADAHGAALEAMAIVARTFAVSHRGRHRSEGFDVCDLTHCQALRPTTNASRKAAASTSERILVWKDGVAEVYYSISCGGTIAHPSEPWPEGGHEWPPYLLSHPDPAGAVASEARWDADLEASAIVGVLRAAGLRGDRLETLTVAERTPGGRVRRLRAAGFTPETVDGETFRLAAGRTVGWQILKSTWFETQRSARGYRFVGRGHGHGVGLCVRGALALASAGWPASRLLAAYFPGTWTERLDREGRVSTPSASRGLPGSTSSPRPGRDGLATDSARPRLRLVLPSAQETSRPTLQRDVVRLIDELSARLGVGWPPTVTVRLHPTVESYQRASGRPWWTAGTTRDATVDLLPLHLLERRGRLEPTLRHELAHVATWRHLEETPLWVREGVAEYFSTPAGSMAASEDAKPCPSDVEFDAARSAADLSSLYAAAAACVAREIRAGRAWDALP